MTYPEKLKDPRWQKKRLEVMNRDGFACVHCGDGASPLNVHHLIYLKGREPWDYLDGYLLTLCKPCHDRCHLVKNAVLLAFNDRWFVDAVERLVALKVGSDLFCDDEGSGEFDAFSWGYDRIKGELKDRHNEAVQNFHDVQQTVHQDS